MATLRSKNNPIIKPNDVKPSRADYEVLCVINAGVIRMDDEVILLLRVAERPLNTDPNVYLSPFYDTFKKSLQSIKFPKDSLQYDFTDSRVIKTEDTMYLTSISHLRVARSKDGVNFIIENKPSFFPENKYEAYGIEDCRISKVEGVYYISYSAISPLGITACLASTEDFKLFKREGVILQPDNKDIAIFPEKINGKYYALHRPTSGVFSKNDIWIAESSDMITWGNHRHLMGSREDYWDNGRIGAGGVPFRVKQGWLEIYHGADKNDRYCLGAVLLDKNQPWKVIARSEVPLMEPVEEYEIKGFFGNVIFTCGNLYEEGIVKIYYGAADTYMAYAEIPMADVYENLKIKK
ncbi:MAG: glycoside hydrolase family 130 protein [Clostridium sp.]|uniref:glycoside hydrolase family 130 protein n=1 Tax=Clostridium sp. TaxID=1506 RepID=UPI003D6D3B2E